MSLKDDKKEINNIKHEVHELQEQSDLYRILTLEDKKNKRLCGIISLLVVLLVISLGYTIYLTSDIGTVEDTTIKKVTQDNTNGNNNYVGNDGDITNGKANN